ncbi:MAG TPA: VOC family protein [Acidimicrobiales bacterium]
MPLRLYHLVIDAHDPWMLARFWAAVLEQDILEEDEEGAIVGADDRAYPGLCFLCVPEGKTTKNRLHIDLDPDDRDTEVERVLGLGATRVDVGQGPEVTWEVLADPEGNEFCVLAPRRTLIS